MMEKILKITDKCLKVLKVLILISIIISIVRDFEDRSKDLYIAIFCTAIMILYELVKLNTSFFGKVKILIPCILSACCILMNIEKVENMAVIYYFFLLDDIFDIFTDKKLYIMSFIHFGGFLTVSIIQQGFNGKEAIEENVINIIMYSMAYLIFTLIHYYKKDRNRYKIINEKIMDLYLKERENLISRERNNITQELHDSLGHILTAALMNIRFLKYKKITEEQELDEIEELVQSAINNIRGCFDKTNRIEENINLEEELKKLIELFHKLGLIKIELEIGEQILLLNKELKLDLYKIIREAIANSIRHGVAKKIVIECKVTEKDEILLLVVDDGVGCEAIEKSMGLNGIIDRVKFWDGMVLFISEKNKGFQVKALIPMKGAMLE